MARNLLHTQMGIKVLTTRLGGVQLRRLRHLLARADLAHPDASDVKPRPDGYRWVLRHAGRVGTGADGHLHGAFGRLVRFLGGVMDRLQARSL